MAETAAETAPAPELEQEEVSYPQITDIQNVSNGVRLRWDSFGFGSTYRVYYREAAVYSGSWDEKYASSGWTRLASVTGTEYVHQGVKDGEARTYTIRCTDAKGTFVSDFDRDGRSTVYYAPPKLTSVNYSDGQYTVTWNANSDITVFRIYRKELGSKDWTAVADMVAGDTFTDASDQNVKICSYTVRAQNESGDLISSFDADNPFYRNGALISGSVTVGGVTYKIVNGRLAKGFYRESGTLYYYRNGLRVTDDIVGSTSEGWYYADQKGICYEGKEMRLAAEFMMKYCKGNTLKEHMKSGYIYLAHQCTYQRRYYLPTTGSDFTEYAVDMFTNHNGNCYCYAGAFALIAKIAGYDVRITVGATGGGVDHSWNEIYSNGKWLYCDSQSEIPTFHVPDYTEYMVEKHRWGVKSDWYSILTLKDGRVKGIEPQPPIMSDFQSLSAYRRSQPVKGYSSSAPINPRKSSHSRCYAVFIEQIFV